MYPKETVILRNRVDPTDKNMFFLENLKIKKDLFHEESML